MDVKKRRSSLVAALFILFLDNFGWAVVFPLFPILFLEPTFGFLPATTTESVRNIVLGFLLTSFPLAQFVGAPFFGDISDRYGRKKAFFFTIIGTICGYILTALSIQLVLFWLLLFARLITGFFSGNLALAMAAVADLSPEQKQRGKNLNLVAALLGISWILAIFVGAAFTNPENLQTFHPAFPFWLIAFLSLVSVIVLALYFHETAPQAPERSVRLLKGFENIFRVLEAERLRTLYFVLFLWFLGFFIALQWTAPLSLEKFKVGEIEIMWLLVFYGLVWALASGWINRTLINRFSLRKLTLACLLAVALLYFFAGVSDYFLYYAALLTVSSFFTAIAYGNSISLISFAATENTQGKTMGLAQSTISLTQLLGPIVGGLIAAISVEPLLYICALLVFAGFALLFFNKPISNHETAS